MASKLLGIAGSGGIAFGKAYIVSEVDLSFDTYSTLQVDQEISRLHHALSQAEIDLQKIREKVRQEQGIANATIFDEQILVLNEYEIIKTIIEIIIEDKYITQCN